MASRARAGLWVVGLGPGGPEHLTAAAVDALCRADAVFLRTARHPGADHLRTALGIDFVTFDDAYEAASSFDELYAGIADRLLAAARVSRAAYAVPGHPLVAEESVRLVLERAPAAGVRVHVVPGMSFLDPLWPALGLDPSSGVQFLDAYRVEDVPPNPALGLVISQVDGRAVASRVKLRLLEFYPPRHPVTVVRGAGVRGEQRRSHLPLERLDRLQWLDHLCAVYVPPLEGASAAVAAPLAGAAAPAAPPGRDAEETRRTFERLLNIVRRLRAPGGCPWDREQTPLTLRPFIIEEAYEVVTAIDGSEQEKLREELGDLMLQVLLQAVIAEESGAFDIRDVMATIAEKLVRRHPHVFAALPVDGSAEVLRNWERIKAGEKGPEGGGLLDGVPPALPALLQAWRVQAKAAHIGFDWPEVEPVFAKVDEELRELRAAYGRGAKDTIQEETGDLLFALVNLSRFLGVEPEMALRSATAKFIARFRFIEAEGRRRGRAPGEMGLAEMDELWDEAKRRGS